MPNAEKIELVGALKHRIEGSDALLLTEYRGLTVSDLTELRRSLAEGGAGLSVVKNTLMRRAAAAASIAELEGLLEGPTAVAFVVGDPIGAAKKVIEAAKRFPTLILKGGYMDGHILSADQAKALAELESRETMLSKVAGLLKGEMSRAAAMFVSAQSTFLALLEAHREKATAGGAEVPPASDAVAQETTPDTDPDTTTEAQADAGTETQVDTDEGGAIDGEDEHG
jgi:large subunit ribosomal protein L10